MTPQLSIIIPCYNYARYLPTCLDSVLQQEFQDFELILIDDGSSDTTWEIMQDYKRRDARIRAVKNEKNQGIFKVNKQGWEMAQGAYLHFFSSDDVYQPSCLSKVMQMFSQNPQLSLVCTDLGYFQDGSEMITTKKALKGCEKPRIFTKREMVLLFQNTDFWIPGLTCIVKQEILKKYGHLDPQLENISDWFCFHKIALFEGVGYIPEKLISMRLHDQTYTSQVKKNKTRRRATYRYLLDFLHHNPEIRAPFQQSGLLTFIFKELYWKLRFRPSCRGYWRYLKKT